MLTVDESMHDTLPPTPDKSPTSFPRPHLSKRDHQPAAHSASLSVNQLRTRPVGASTRCALGEVLAVRLGVGQPVEQLTIELLGVFLVREVADAI